MGCNRRRSRTQRAGRCGPLVELRLKGAAARAQRHTRRRGAHGRMQPARFPARPVCGEPEHVRRLAVLCRAQTKPGCGPIPLRLLLAAQPVLVTPVLQVVHRVITRHLLEQTGFKADEADSGAVTLIQRFGSAASLNIHLHCLVLDGVYRRIDGGPVVVQADSPTDEALQALLHKIITRLMKLLTRRGVLVEEEGEGSSYLADADADSDEARALRPLQAAACTCRIAFGPRAGQKV